MLPFRVYKSLSCWYYGHPREGWPWGTILALSPISRSEYSQCNLPSYQFENSRHWIERMDQALHILQNGLRCKAHAATAAPVDIEIRNSPPPPPPAHSKIIAPSPSAQIVQENYRTSGVFSSWLERRLGPLPAGAENVCGFGSWSRRGGIAIVERIDLLFRYSLRDEGEGGEREVVRDGSGFLSNSIK